MKLRKQAPAKAAIAIATAGLILAFYAVVRAEPRIKAATVTPTAPVNYDRFFAPNTSVPIATPEPVTPHGRTRAS